jgi:hypothetical protein
MATRMQQRRGTAAQWTAANPVLGAGEIGFETDTGKFKIGDGTNQWGSLDYFTTIDEALGDIIDGAPAALNTLNELAAALDDDANFATTIANQLSQKVSVVQRPAAEWTSLNPVVPMTSIGYEGDTQKFKVGDGTTAWNSLPYVIDEDLLDLYDYANNTDLNLKAPIDNPTFTGLVSLPNTTEIGSITSSEIATLGGVTSSIQTQLNEKAPSEDPIFTGSAQLPSATTIGDVSAEEIGYLNGVTSSIQTQINNKADSSTVSTTYAPLSGPTFTGTVTLPSTTSIGSVSNTEIAYLNGVTSDIQTQLNAKAPTADPTFTGTVSGITKSMVGLGNVDNTADADKPVSTATQTALDAKLSLSGGTMTGALTLSGAPTQANHAATKAYADSIAEGLHVHASCVAATTANVNLSNALENGDVLDGVTLVTGDRVLVKNQTAAEENGIYIVQASGAALRASDFNEPMEVDGGDFVFVTGGTVNDNTGWVQTATNVVTIGTDPITFVQFAGAGTITAGTNISVNGSEVSVVNNPTFSGLVTAATAGVAFSDGTQTKEGVPSRTAITQVTAAYNLSTGGLSLRDGLVEVSHTGGSAVTVTIPADSTTNFPIGTSIDVLRTNTGGVTIAGAAGVTVNATPGLNLRAQWSSVTLFKRAANTWVAFGDLAS